MILHRPGEIGFDQLAVELDAGEEFRVCIVRLSIKPQAHAAIVMRLGSFIIFGGCSEEVPGGEITGHETDEMVSPGVGAATSDGGDLAVQTEKRPTSGDNMKVLVPVKPVADPNTAPAAWIKSETGEEDTTNYVANYFDLIAVERAIRLKDIGVDDICIVSVTDDSKLAQVRSAIAMGANRAVLIDPQGRKPGWFQIAAVLKHVVDKEQPSMVLMGKQATDDDASQVGPLLAGMLGWPQATFVSEMTVNEDRTRVECGRETDEGVEVIDVKLPAVITCDLRLNEPRYATLPNLIKSKKAPMERLKFSDLGIDDPPRVSVVGHELPAGRSGECQIVADTAELVSVLKERKLVN